MPQNAFGQWIGESVENVSKGQFPHIDVLPGQTVRVEKIGDNHFDDLFTDWYSIIDKEWPDKKKTSRNLVR